MPNDSVLEVTVTVKKNVWFWIAIVAFVCRAERIGEWFLSRCLRIG